MKQSLKPADILLLGLAGLVDIFEEMRDPLGIQASYCQNVYGWVPERFKRHNFVRLVERQIKNGNLEKETNNTKTFLRLTMAGQEKIMRDYPIFKLQNRHWDGKWRIVFFDILETSRHIRNTLRLKLKELGFGMLQRSVWVTPSDIINDFTQFLRTAGLENQVYVVETRRLLSGDVKILAEKIWHLNNLNEEYKSILEEIKVIKTMYIANNGRGRLYTEDDKQERDNTAIKTKVYKTKRRYLELLLKDPFLPKELLPEGWNGETIKKEIKRIKTGL